MTVASYVAAAWLVFSSALFPGALLAEPQQEQQQSVLLLDQSSAGLPFNTALASSIRLTINATSKSPVSFYFENLDANRFSGAEYEKNFVNFLKAKYRNRPIDVVIAVGVSAFDFITRQREQIWPSSSIPVVFAAIDEATFASLTLPANATGATMQLTLQDMVKVARMAVPSLKTVAIVGDPLERQTFYRHFKDELPAIGEQLEIVSLMNLPMADLKGRLASLSEDTAVIYTGIYYDGEGVSYMPAELVPQIAEWANRPVVVNVSSYLNKGAIGGYIVQADPIGRTVARLALRILNGESASAMPVVKVASPLIFESPALQRWNVSESALPPGSEVRFRKPSLWDQYRAYSITILAAVLGQALLIAWLVYEHRRRSGAEVRSRNALAELTYMNRVVGAGVLSASIAHEISQPLTGIATRASAALRWLHADKPNIEKVESSLTQIVEATHRAGDIVTSVRGLFQRETGERSQVDINTLVQTALSIARIDLLKNRVYVETQLNHQLPALRAEKVQLEQVLLNLIMNAVDAMQTVELRELTVTTGQNKQDTIYVSVEDTGTGIDPTKIESIFKALFTTKSRGLGMGLSICQSIIQNHGGRIWAVPGAVRGSIFQFELPITS